MITELKGENSYLQPEPVPAVSVDQSGVVVAAVVSVDDY